MFLKTVRLVFSKNFDFSNFKQYMDAQPTIRNFMFAFYNREYSAGLRALELLRSEFKLDLFLSPHVDNLFDKIRSESIKQVHLLLLLES